jgi:hypothetical protein
MDGTVHPAASQKRTIGRIDNGIEFKGGYIPLHDFDAIKRRLFHF